MSLKYVSWEITSVSDSPRLCKTAKKTLYLDDLWLKLAKWHKLAKLYSLIAFSHFRHAVVTEILVILYRRKHMGIVHFIRPPEQKKKRRKFKITDKIDDTNYRETLYKFI